MFTWWSGPVLLLPDQSDLDQSRLQWDEPCCLDGCTPAWIAAESHIRSWSADAGWNNLPPRRLALGFMQNLQIAHYLKLLMKCLNASVLFDRGIIMLTRMLCEFRHLLVTFTRGPKGLKSATWVKACGFSALNVSSYTVPRFRSVRVNPKDVCMYGYIHYN